MTARLRVAFKTLGCKVNRVESEDVAADLLGKGAMLAEPNCADVIVINTCTVTAEADAKARKAVRQALAEPTAPIVVVTGCLASVDAPAVEALGERVVVEQDKARVSARVAELLGLDEDPGHGPAVRTGEGFRTRAMLKIEDGCDVFCSYCIVPHARGVPRAVPLEQVADQAAAFVASGAREIVLTGINLGRYRDADADLATVVEVVANSGIERLRLSSIEPPDLTPRLLDVLAQTPSVCRHLHVPLQSGSDDVLARMQRTYNTAEYRQLIDFARAALPGLTLTTDVMVGFPGETDQQAAETVAFCEEIGFSKLHVFRYSVRPGTPAAEMVQVDARIKAERALSLRRAGERMRQEFLEAHLGGSAEVLVESVDEDGRVEGTTCDYVRVVARASHDRPGAPALGSLVSVQLARVAGDRLEGVIE